MVLWERQREEEKRKIKQDMPLSFDNLRVGHIYKMTNHGEQFEFKVVSSQGESDFDLKDTTTLEQYQLSELIFLGKGKDFDLQERPNEA